MEDLNPLRFSNKTIGIKIKKLKNYSKEDSFIFEWQTSCGMFFLKRQDKVSILG